jgi:hypothetical protein
MNETPEDSTGGWEPNPDGTGPRTFEEMGAWLDLPIGDHTDRGYWCPSPYDVVKWYDARPELRGPELTNEEILAELEQDEDWSAEEWATWNAAGRLRAVIDEVAADVRDRIAEGDPVTPEQWQAWERFQLVPACRDVASHEGDDAVDYAVVRMMIAAGFKQEFARAYETAWSDYRKRAQKGDLLDKMPIDWLLPGEGLAAHPLPVARIKTGIQTLDDATRGGLPTGTATLVLGAPDAGKTGAAMTIADEAERQGAFVVHLAVDGGREAAEIRWGQMMGFDRRKLEDRNAEECKRFRETFFMRNVFLPDPDLLDGLMPVNTFAHIIEKARTRLHGRKVLLLLDSLQTVRPDEQDHDGPRMRIEAMLGLVRKAANIPGWLVVSTSQTNRASRRHKNDADNTDPMTAGMESGAIEHYFDVMLYLDGDAAGIQGVRVRVTKNKPGAGRKPIFNLSWSKDRARFVQPTAKTFEQETLDMVERNAAEMRDEVLTKLKKEKKALSTAGVVRLVTGREVEITKALWKLKELGLVVMVEKGGYWWSEAPPPDTSSR